MRLSILFLFSTFMLFVVGCSSSLGVSDYLSWNNENPINEEVNVGDVLISCIYKPSPLMALNDLREEVYLVAKDSVRNIISEYDSSTFIVLKFDTKGKNQPILKYNLKSEQEYHDRIFYLTTQVQNDLEAINGEDTLKLANHIFERAYSIRSYENVLLAFQGKLNPNKPLTIKYTGLFAEEPVIFEFDTKTLNNIPNLKI